MVKVLSTRRKLSLLSFPPFLGELQEGGSQKIPLWWGPGVLQRTSQAAGLVPFLSQLPLLCHSSHKRHVYGLGAPAVFGLVVRDLGCQNHVHVRHISDSCLHTVSAAPDQTGSFNPGVCSLPPRASGPSHCPGLLAFLAASPHLLLRLPAPGPPVLEHLLSGLLPRVKASLQAARGFPWLLPHCSAPSAPGHTSRLPALWSLLARSSPCPSLVFLFPVPPFACSWKPSPAALCWRCHLGLPSSLHAFWTSTLDLPPFCLSSGRFLPLPRVHLRLPSSVLCSRLPLVLHTEPRLPADPAGIPCGPHSLVRPRPRPAPLIVDHLRPRLGAVLDFPSSLAAPST